MIPVSVPMKVLDSAPSLYALGTIVLSLKNEKLSLPWHFYKTEAVAGAVPVWWLHQLPSLQGGKMKGSCWARLEAALPDTWGCALPQVCCTGLNVRRFHPGLPGWCWPNLSAPPSLSSLGIILLLPHTAPRSCGCCGWMWPSGHRGTWPFHCSLPHRCCQPCQLRGQFALHSRSLPRVCLWTHGAMFFLFCFLLQSF